MRYFLLVEVLAILPSFLNDTQMKIFKILAASKLDLREIQALRKHHMKNSLCARHLERSSVGLEALVTLSLSVR